jgi:hypothetical protein
MKLYLRLEVVLNVDSRIVDMKPRIDDKNSLIDDTEPRIEESP